MVESGHLQLVFIQFSFMSFERPCTNQTISKACAMHQCRQSLTLLLVCRLGLFDLDVIVALRLCSSWLGVKGGVHLSMLREDHCLPSPLVWLPGMSFAW